MSWFSSVLDGTKRELNRQFDRKKPEIIAAVRAEARRARDKGDTGDAFKDALVFAVHQYPVFGPIEFLVIKLITGIPIKGKSLTEIENGIVGRIQGARL